MWVSPHCPKFEACILEMVLIVNSSFLKSTIVHAYSKLVFVIFLCPFITLQYY